jgi:hypothetical protein
MANYFPYKQSMHILPFALNDLQMTYNT